MPNPHITTAAFLAPSIPAAPVPIIPADAARSVTLVNFGNGNPVEVPTFSSPADPDENGDAYVVAERIAFGFVA